MRPNLLAAAALLGVVPCVSISADRPDLPVPPQAGQLQVVMAEPELWNGQGIPRALQCLKNGGIAPVRSPVLKIGGVPEGTERVVVHFANPRAGDNHGLFSHTPSAPAAPWTVPAVGSNQKAKLPAGIEVFQGGSTWGAAYSSPCPGSGSWKYTVTVYALGPRASVLAVGEADLGWSE